MGTVLYLQVEPRDLAISQKIDNHLKDNSNWTRSPLFTKKDEFLRPDKFRPNNYYFKNLKYIADFYDFLKINSPQKISEHLFLPRIINCLNEIDRRNSFPKKIILVITKPRRPRRENDFFNENATFYLRNIIKEIVNQTFKNDPNFELLTISENFENTNLIFIHLNQIFTTRQQFNHDSDDEIFLMNRGVLQPISIALLQVFNNKYSSFTLVESNLFDDEIRFSKLSILMKKKNAESLVYNFTNKFRYSSALAVAEEELKSKIQLIEYLQAAHKLFSLEFGTFKEALDKWDEELDEFNELDELPINKYQDKNKLRNFISFASIWDAKYKVSN